MGYAQDLFDELMLTKNTDGLGKDQAHAYETVVNTPAHFFITGVAGSGKTTLLRHIVNNQKLNRGIAAPSGIAALNVDGQTIHSLFRLPPFGILSQRDVKFLGRDPSMNPLLSMEQLIIDEISMVRADLLDAIDMTLRINRNHDVPFGGVQVLMFGDLNQLPPVLKPDEMQAFSQIYTSPYFFAAKVMKSINIQRIALTHVFRQKDPVFIGILNRIKNNTCSQADLDVINHNCYDSSYQHTSDVISLCTVNRQVDFINERRLDELPAEKMYNTGILAGEFKENMAPVPINLSFKEGCRVMFRVNDRDKRWFNGTLGTITEVKNSQEVTVETDSGDKWVVGPNVWEMKKQKVNPMTGDIEPMVVGTYTQMPFVLGFSISIHKSQGCTFEKMYLDFVDGTFASGQAYVGLSRVTGMEGLKLARPLMMSDIKFDPMVSRWLAGQ